jgi:cystathionine beta-lyase/cystathionine gamma-synthase
MKPDTLCARPPESPPSVTAPLAPALQLSSVYRIEGLDQIDALSQGAVSGFTYARDGHPNAAQLAAKTAALEGAEAALVCGAGMAAEAAILLTTLEQGDHVALSAGLYGKTTRLVTRELARFGIDHSLFDATGAESLRAALTFRTRLVFVETLSNPLVRVADLDGLAAIAHEAGVMLVVDNTFAPLICRPLEHGADVVTHSATKLISGHSDVTLGLVAGPREFIARAAEVASTFGLTGPAFESWLTLRGLATLALRSARACANALTLAERLSSHPAVQAVHYPGLPAHPDHARASRLLHGGFGAMMAIDLGTRERVDAFIHALKHIVFAPSLGDVATTLSHPTTTSHRDHSAEECTRLGITPGLVRLSIGVEDPEDLWEDFKRGLRAFP